MVLPRYFHYVEILPSRHEERTNLGRAEPIEVGAMIEIPAAAVAAWQLAEVCDFFSIGTNDLTQYALAPDRGNPAVATGVDALHPCVLGPAPETDLMKIARRARRHSTR